jgi:sulfate adenylyltransferase subunit 2
VTDLPAPLSHLDLLEAEAIHVLREAVAEAEQPVLLYSAGKDSSVLLHLALKAFHPAPPPFPLLHVASGWDFRDLLAFRDARVRELGLTLHVYRNEAGAREGLDPLTGGARYADVMLTAALRQALDRHGFDVAFGGARRDEERSRAKERIFSLRQPGHRWDPRRQRPELWRNYNVGRGPGETLRVFPLSNWTELDVWQYLHRERIAIVPLYFAAPRPVVERDGRLIVVDDARLPLAHGERPVVREVRFRTLGCWPLSGALPSQATTLAAIIAETVAATTSERRGRAIDRDGAAAMERRKHEGYF